MNSRRKVFRFQCHSARCKDLNFEVEVNKTKQVNTKTAKKFGMFGASVVF